MKFIHAVIVAGILFGATNATTTIIGGSVTGGGAQTNGGTFVKLSDPIGNVGDNNHQSNNLFGFDEKQNVFLSSNLTVDIVAAGQNNPLSAGQEVASHYIFFDPAVNRTITGTVEFDSDIVAIITSRDNLIASDGLVNLSANYLSPDLRGLEAGDGVTITGARTISVDFFANSPGDYIRVLTQFSPAAAPEPGTFAVIIFSLFTISLLRRRAI
jgi:hypothetical protein